MKETQRVLPFHKVEHAQPDTIWEIMHLMEPFVKDGSLVPLTSIDVYNNMSNFVLVRQGKEAIGCGQLVVYRHDLAEIRSVCVREDLQRQGIGTTIVNRLLIKAQEQDISHLLVITNKPEFWEKIGFFETVYNGDHKKSARIKEL